MDPTALIMWNYLEKVIYEPANARLDVDALPKGFQEFGKGLRYFAECIIETNNFSKALARGELTMDLPRRDNELSASLKSLHASLRHLTWQTKQVAKGDYNQRVSFMGEFADSFNSMIGQLEQRKKEEDAEKSKLHRYIDMLLSNIPECMLIFDAEGKAVLASDAYLRCGNISTDAFRGKTFTELFSDISTSEFQITIEGLISKTLLYGCISDTEQSIDFKQDGNLRSYIINLAPMFWDNEIILGAMVIFHDVTEIIQAQREAEIAREQAEHLSKVKSEFLSRMSHEIRTPMNAVIGMTAIGKAATTAEKKDYSLHKIEGASKHLLGVINDVLDMSKIEADKFELLCEEFDFHSMMDHVTNIIGMYMAEKKQDFTVDIDSKIPGYIITDEQRLAQVITNLLSNAVKFTPESGKIALSAEITDSSENNHTIRFTVKDSGIGISEEQQSRLFTPFEQADGSTCRNFGGTGLGLSISKRIVELMDGSIWIESELGKGASFIFQINVRSCDFLNTTDDVETVEHDENGILAGKRILVAEDVEINREIISAVLEDTGADIVFANNGTEAVKHFQTAPNDYVLILMDVNMPEMDGYEATNCIRSSGLKQADKIPIIAMTASVFREDIDRCLAAGMNGHLGKPLDTMKVISTIKKHLAMTA